MKGREFKMPVKKLVVPSRIGSYTVKYNGFPLKVIFSYALGKFIILDNQKKEFGAEYSSYERAYNHAKGWNTKFSHFIDYIYKDFKGR